MRFSHAKLPVMAAQDMRVCPIYKISPFSLMLAPVYVFMRRNEKFVAIKAPLDFFLPEEIEKLKPLESFFIPKFVDKALPFINSAHRVKAVMTWLPPESDISENIYPEVTLPPPPYEVSDAVLKIMGPLWGAALSVEPFFVTVFANEVCEPLPETLLRQTREKDINIFESAIFRSSLTVFLGLHLGYMNLEYLNALRLRAFNETLAAQAPIEATNEAEELVLLAGNLVHNVEVRKVTLKALAERPERTAQKIISRLERVRGEMIKGGEPSATVFGPEGFIDV